MHNAITKPREILLLSSLQFYKSLFVLWCGVSILAVVYLSKSIIRGIHDPYLLNNASLNEIRSLSSKNPDASLRKTGKKIFIAFHYWEQLTSATNNLLDLTALAAYGGRQVVVPFVKNSWLYGSPTKKHSETLALYYNITALNNTLRSRGHGTLISWKDFQDVCQGRLDVLVHFKYNKHSRITRPYWPCNRGRNVFKGFKIERTICMNVFAVDSVEQFENEVVKRLPCTGLSLWRGSRTKNPNRAQFNLSSVLTYRMHSRDDTFFLSSKLFNVAQDFIAKNLGTPFYSVHIRTEQILKLAQTFSDVNAVNTCISNLSTLVQRHKNLSTAHNPVFLAADFTDYGSSSLLVKPARNIAESLMKILAPLKPVLFQPSAYNLTDRGAVAIVEMNILVSGKHLFVVGGGSFQRWVVNQFIHKNNIERISTAKCQNELCNNLCYF